MSKWSLKDTSKKTLRDNAERQARYSQTIADEEDFELAGWEKVKPQDLEQYKTGIISRRDTQSIGVLYEHIFVEAIPETYIKRKLLNTFIVGDRVAIEEKNNTYIIKYRYPRETFLARIREDGSKISAFTKGTHIIAANVDIAVIVASLKTPEFHPRFIDRYLIICQYGNVKPIICLNKFDLVGDEEIEAMQPFIRLYEEHLGIPVILSSTVTGIGLDALKNNLQGKITAFVGNSGVGKSTLINTFKKDLHVRTQDVSDKTGKGKHTTTSYNMYELFADTYVIDTPGVRALGISHIAKANLQEYFPEFLPYRNMCKYTDCLHVSIDGCAITQAVEEEKIDVARYESYTRLLSELH